MSSASPGKPVLRSVSPRLAVGEIAEALAFYGHLGFETTYHDGDFAIVERDGVALHFNASSEPPKRRSVCWIALTNIDALYQEYLSTGAVQSTLEAKPWGFKVFFVNDPWSNLLLFAEGIDDLDARPDSGLSDESRLEPEDDGGQDNHSPPRAPLLGSSGPIVAHVLFVNSCRPTISLPLVSHRREGSTSRAIRQADPRAACASISSQVERLSYTARRCRWSEDVGLRRRWA